MKTIMKDNVQYIIQDSKLDEYIKKGFVEVTKKKKGDKKGNKKVASKLENMSQKELLVIAKEVGIEKADGLTMEELIKAIRDKKEENDG